ncbi:single-stranded DNA-binding protein [Campylobacter coli]
MKTKGSKIFLQGRLVQENYTDKEGKNRTSYKIAVETMKFLDSKPADNNQSGNPYANVQSTPEPVNQSVQKQVPIHQFEEQQGEDLPF